MIKRLFFAILMVLPGGASAQVALDYHDRFQTRFGEMQVVGGEVDQRLWFNGAFLPLPVQSRYYIHGAYALAEDAFDWVLVSHHHGGNSCGGAYHIIRVSGLGAEISPEIGSCALPVLDIRLVPGMMELDLIHMDVAIDRETFAFDGTTLTRVEDHQIAQAAAGLGADITRWIGTHPYDLLEDPSERARFRTIMTDEDMAMLANHVQVANSVVQRDAWVIGQGCLPHNCGDARGLWGIRIADGGIAAAMRTGDGRVRAYGAAGDPGFATAQREHME